MCYFVIIVTSLLHDVEEDVGRTTSCIWTAYSRHIWIVAIVPTAFPQVFYFSNVVAGV